MKWDFVVIDFDGTFDSVFDENDYGVMPIVYAVPEDKKEVVVELANKAHDIFHEDETSECMGDILANLMLENHIPNKYVGSIPLRFYERKENYMTDGISFVLI